MIWEALTILFECKKNIAVSFDICVKCKQITMFYFTASFVLFNVTFLLNLPTDILNSSSLDVHICCIIPQNLVIPIYINMVLKSRQLIPPPLELELFQDQ